MLDGYKIVTISPVGRRKYLNVLLPYLLRDSDIIDQHIFWINTDNTYDISAVYSMVCQNPDFFAIKSLDSQSFDKNVNKLYLDCNDKQTIYIKINDDICWLHESALVNLIDFRIQNPDFFLIYPMIINTGRVANLHQIMGHLPLSLTGEWDGKYRSYFDLRLQPPCVSEKIHKSFLRQLNKDITKLFVGKYILYDEYLPEHCICWFGRDFIKFNNTNIDKYDFLNVETLERHRYSCICGNSLVSHFSFSNHQKYLLEETNIYSRYEKLSKKVTNDL
jgi:hypothetical protein